MNRKWENAIKEYSVGQQFVLRVKDDAKRDRITRIAPVILLVIMVSCTCVLTGIYIAKMGNIIVLLMILAGVVMGTLNGVITAKLKLPSFIVTLCTQNFWNYVALILCPNGSIIIPMNMPYSFNTPYRLGNS